MTKITQRGTPTRNQSTVDFTNSCIFTFDNRFIESSFKAAADVVVSDGMLVVRDTTTGNVKLATSTDLANVIGVLKVCGSVSLKSGEEIPVNVCTSGSIDSGLLVMPSGVTLDTVVGNKQLRDVLEGLGLHLTPYVENTYLDN